jgi:hypothetical protein
MRETTVIEGMKIKSLNWLLGGCSIAARLERGQRAKWEKNQVERHCCLWLKKSDIDMSKPILVELCRHANRFWDDDNLVGGFKHVRDGVAHWLGIDDGDSRLTWRYLQVKEKVGTYYVSVTIEQ